MDAAPRTTLNLRLADACRVEQHGLIVLDAIAANRKLARVLRDRAELHLVETQAQLNQTRAALATLAPSLARRLAEPAGHGVDGQPGAEQWMALERREISAYQGVLAYCHHGAVEGLAEMCAAAIDLQRGVLMWLEAGHGDDPRAGWLIGPPGTLGLAG
ncbi:hypothetical protein [Pseudoxanthomonas sp. 10H]|uniref:hypothetical protein n=1 Tax=Pseudoxanthomonas sp. 10H TaxID=3242729 RepID=UPI003556C9B9